MSPFGALALASQAQAAIKFKTSKGDVMTFILTIVGGLVLFALISMSVTSPGRSLQRKFVELGTLSGKTRAEIEAAVGAPSSVSATADGGTLIQWMATGYHIALTFDAQGICGGVTHEFASS